MKLETPLYLKELEDADWVQEVVSETFDGVLELMTPHCVVYGGAIRDCLAGLELVGDLDIAVSRQEFDDLSLRIQHSPRWVPSDKEKLAQLVSESSEVGNNSPPWAKKLSSIAPGPSKFGRSSGDLARKLAPMEGVCSFTDCNGKEVQIITSKQHTKDPFQDALYMVRMVDITCCAVLMTADGRVFEVVPGAFEDCKNRVLSLNESSTTVFIDALPSRVAKLEKRGWKNTIDVKIAMRDVKRRQEKEKQRQQRQLLASRRKGSLPNLKPRAGIMVDDVETHSCVTSMSDPIPDRSGPGTRYGPKEVKKYLGDNVDEVRNTIECAANHLGMNVVAEITPLGYVTLRFNSTDQLHNFRRTIPSGRYKKRAESLGALVAEAETARRAKKAPTLGYTVTGRFGSKEGIDSRVADVHSKLFEKSSKFIKRFEMPPKPTLTKEAAIDTSMDEAEEPVEAALDVSMNPAQRSVTLSYIDREQDEYIEVIINGDGPVTKAISSMWPDLDDDQKKQLIADLRKKGTP